MMWCCCILVVITQRALTWPKRNGIKCLKWSKRKTCLPLWILPIKALVKTWMQMSMRFAKQWTWACCSLSVTHSQKIYHCMVSALAVYLWCVKTKHKPKQYKVNCSSISAAFTQAHLRTAVTWLISWWMTKRYSMNGYKKCMWCAIVSKRCAKNCVTV